MRCIYKKLHYLTFNLDLGVKVIRNVAQYPLHHVTYLGTKFKVDMSNGLGGDAFTRNVTDRQMDRQTTDRLWYEINIAFFSKEKSGYNDIPYNNYNTHSITMTRMSSGGVPRHNHPLHYIKGLISWNPIRSLQLNHV